MSFYIVSGILNEFPYRPPAVNSASLVSFSAPTAVGPGQAFTATLTLRNTGNTVWTSPLYDPYRPHRLGSEDPINNARWGLARAEIPVPSVSPGQDVTISLNATAPLEQGDYPFDWRMVEEGVEFFGRLAQQTISVNQAAAGVTIRGNKVDINNSLFTNPGPEECPVFPLQRSGRLLKMCLGASAGDRCIPGRAGLRAWPRSKQFPAPLFPSDTIALK